jgi:uncharacterized membrane protein YbhN (UPF0104 family)
VTASGPVSGTSAGSQAGGTRSAQKPKRRHRTALRLAFEAVVVAAAAVFVVLRAGSSLGAVGATFQHLHWHWLLLSGAAEGGSIFCLSWLQAHILREGHLRVGAPDLLPVTMASNAVTLSLPAGSLFAEGYSFRQYQRLGAGWALGLWAELAAGALQAFALATVALAGALVVGASLRVDVLPALAFVWVGAGVAAALFRRPGLLGRLVAKVLSGTGRRLPSEASGHLRRAEQSLAQMDCFRPSKSLWVKCWLVGTGNWLLDAVVLVGGLLTVGAPVPWRAVLLCYAGAQLLVELPITPGGLGLVEGGLTELLTRFHLTVTQATAGTLMYRAVSYWLLLIVGGVAAGWLAFRHRRAAPGVAAGKPAGVGAAAVGAVGEWRDERSDGAGAGNEAARVSRPASAPQP